MKVRDEIDKRYTCFHAERFIHKVLGSRLIYISRICERWARIEPDCCRHVIGCFLGCAGNGMGQGSLKEIDGSTTYCRWHILRIVSNYAVVFLFRLLHNSKFLIMKLTRILVTI